MRQLMQEFPEAFRPVRSFEQDGRRVEIGSPMRVGGRGGNDLVIPVYIYDEQGRPHITMAYTSQSHATYRRMTGYFVDRIYKGPVSQHFQNFDWHIQRELDRVVSGRRPIAVERGGQQLDLLEFGMRPPGHDGASRPRSYDAFDGILQGFMRNEDMLQRSMQRDTEPVDISQPGNQPSRVVAHWEAESEFYGRYVRAVVSSENGRYQYVVAVTEDGIFLQQVQDTRSGRVTLAGSPERGVLLTDRSLLTPIIDYTGEGEGATLLGADRAGTVQGRGVRQRLLNLHTSEVSPLFGLQNGLDGVLRALRDGDMRSVDQQLAAMERGQIPCISTERPVQRSDEEVRPAAESRLDRLQEAFRIYQESRDAQGNLSEEHVSQLRAMGITQSDIDYFRTYSGFPDQIVERRLRTRAFRWARDHPEVRVAPREEATGGPRGAPAEARQPVPEVRQPVQPEQPQVRQEAEVRPEAHEAGRPAPVPGSAEDLRQRAEALHRQYAEYEDNLLSLLRTGTAPDAQTRARMAAAREEAVRLEQQAVLQDPESRAMLLINRGASAEELRREAAGSREYSHRMEEGLQGNGVGYLARRRSMIARAEAEARILEEAARAREEGRPYPPLAAEDIVTRLSHGMGNLDPNERAHAIDAFADMGRQEQESVLVGLRAAGRHGDALALEALMRDEDYHAARQSARRTGDRQHELDIIARYARLGQGAQAVVTAEPMRRDVIDATFGPILSGRSRSRDGETVRFSRGRGEPAVEYTRTEYERAAALALYVQEILSGARREGDSIPPELASRFRDLSSQDLQNAIGYLLADARSGADTRSQLAAAFDAIQGRELLFSRYETDLSYRRDDVEINSEALGDDEVRTRLPGMVGELMMRYQQNERFRNLIDERRAARARSEGHEISPDEEILHIAREYIYMDMQAQAPETQQPVPEVRQPVQPVGQEAPAQPAMQQPQSERDLSPISRDLYDVAQALLFRDPNGDMQRTGEVRRAGRHQFGRMSEEMQDAVLYMITGGSAYEQGDASARLWVAQVLGSSIETAGRTAVPSHDRLVQVAQAAYRVVYGGGSLDGSIITNTEEARAFGRFYRQMRAARQPVSIDDVVRVYETSRGVDSEAR
jgi:hypothetical protein